MGTMSELEDPGPSRVGPAQREAAIAALAAHRQAERLTSTQFEERQVLADDAQTWADLERLFVDLPPPHPHRPVPPAVPRDAQAPTSGPTGGGIAWGPGLAAAIPIIALILFFVTGSWLAFLLVPLVWIFTKGPGRRR